MRTVREVIQAMQEDEDEDEDAPNDQPALPRKKRGAHKGPGVVAMLALGVDITDDQ